MSDGSGWSSYSVLRPTFSPPLGSAPEGWSPLVGIGAVVEPDPVIIASTWDNRVNVSTDDAASFREIPLR